MNTIHESTYALLVRSDEKGRNLLELALYTLFILSAVVSIWQLACHPVRIPAAGLRPSVAVACNAQSDRVES